MPEQVDVAVIGAGPFGLSVAAWLPDRRARVFGESLQTWRTVMPPDMLLRSAWNETSLSARDGGGTIDEFAAEAGVPRQEPLPVELFIEYGEWFRKRYVRDNDPADVAHVARDGGRFRLVTTAGDEVTAATVVVAVGAVPFANAPDELADALGGPVSFAVAGTSFEHLAGCRVVVVGAGQSGLESAALAAAAGADVEVLARSGVRWFADHEPQHERGRARAALYRLAYPVLGYGPPPLNRLAVHPDLFAKLPLPARRRLARRILRPGGSPWLRSAIGDRVRVTTGVGVRGCEAGRQSVRLSLSDGSVREADHVLLATGYRFRLDRIAWLDPTLRAEIHVADGWPALNRGFESTANGLRFVGYAAEGRFGPVSRFVLGAGFSARRVAATLP